MKKLIKIVCTALCLTMVTACSDSSAKLPSANDKVITVGNSTLTKGDLFNTLRNNGGGDIAIDRALRRIAAIEIESTDEINEKAQSYVDGLKGSYGDRWESILAESGRTEEEFFNTYVESLKVDSLKAKYIEQNFEDICEKYKPVKAIVLTFTDINQAAYCQRALNTNVLTPSEAATEYGAGSSAEPQFFTLASTTYDAEARAIINSSTPEDEWAYVANEAGDTYYVIHVESNTPADFKDDVIAQLTIEDTVKEDSTKFWFEKYDFHIYDISILNDIKNNSNYALIQEVSE